MPSDGYEAFSRRKDDLVVMKNDDNCTDELRGVQYELIFKSDYVPRLRLRRCVVPLGGKQERHVDGQIGKHRFLAVRDRCPVSSMDWHSCVGSTARRVN